MCDIDSGASHDEPSNLLLLQVDGGSAVVRSLPCIVAFRDAHGLSLRAARACTNENLLHKLVCKLLCSIMCLASL